MIPGLLTPFMKVPAQKGDIFRIKLINRTLTHPTLGPLFGSYKLQHFVFSCPIILYNSWLHNNRTGIGSKMKEVKLPTFTLSGIGGGDSARGNFEIKTNSSSLPFYLGIKGARGKNIVTGKILIRKQFLFTSTLLRPEKPTSVFFPRL